MNYRYIPLLKAKAGEIEALGNLTSSARSRILPLIHIGETLSPKFAQKFSIAWGNQPVGVDGSFNLTKSGAAATYLQLVQTLRQAGTPAIPSVNQTDLPAYIATVSSLRDQNGLIVKTSLTNLIGSSAWVFQQGWHPQEVDLVIDLKSIAGVDHQMLSGYLLSVLQQGAQTLASFRSVTLAASAAPKDHGSLNRGSNRVPRADWLLWQSTVPFAPIKLDYGDYGTGHPDLTEPPGAAMANATVSARYSLDAEWLIIKGRSTGGAHGLPMALQYSSHAGVISTDPNFGGLNGCWADASVAHVASGGTGMGSRQKWAEISANRHISLVADRLP